MAGWLRSVVLCVLAVAGSAAALAGEVSERSFASSLLGRPYQYSVYLPDGYASDTRQYPVLYLLHGAGGDHRAWAKRGDIRRIADQLIASGEIPPAIIIMPGCPGCWWVDGARESGERAFWEELLPHVARTFRVIDRREGRLVAGLSAGGFGAVRFAFKYPDRIAAAAALSPAIYSALPPSRSAARKQHAFMTMDGTFDAGAWKTANYTNLIDGYFAQPYRVPLYLSSGDHDRFGIAFETAMLFQHLFRRQPDKVEFRVIDGGHSWKVWCASIVGAMRYMFKFAARPGDPASPPYPSTVAGALAAPTVAASRRLTAPLDTNADPH